MLSINTTIDAKFLALQLQHLGIIDLTKYIIKDVRLLSVQLENEYNDGKQIFSLISIYELTLQRNGRDCIYTVKITNKNKANLDGLANLVNNTVEIY